MATCGINFLWQYKCECVSRSRSVRNSDVYRNATIRINSNRDLKDRLLNHDRSDHIGGWQSSWFQDGNKHSGSQVGIVRYLDLAERYLWRTVVYLVFYCRHFRGSWPYGFFPHRALAAFLAIAERFLGPSAAALATPPLRPPRRPSATAAGFFFCGAGASVRGASPMDSRNTRWASSFGSLGRAFFDRSSMIQVCQVQESCQCVRISN